MIHFAKCSVCPVDPGLDCYAQVTGAAGPYCRRIAKGDAQACALVLDLSAPVPDPEPEPVPMAAAAEDLGPVPPPDSNPEEEAAAIRAAKPRMALGVPQVAPAGCVPCQEAAAATATRST